MVKISCFTCFRKKKKERKDGFLSLEQLGHRVQKPAVEVEAKLERELSLSGEKRLAFLDEDGSCPPSTISHLPNDGYKNCRDISDEDGDDIGDNLYPVLNPVENISQWKVAKIELNPPEKENHEIIESKEEPRFNESRNSSEPTTPLPQKRLSSSSPCSGSNHVWSIEDRPILGALTLEEINQFSASTTPRKPPIRRSPDDMPIIGIVGTYWSKETCNGGGRRSGTLLVPNL